MLYSWCRKRDLEVFLFEPEESLWCCTKFLFWEVLHSEWRTSQTSGLRAPHLDVIISNSLPTTFLVKQYIQTIIILALIFRITLINLFLTPNFAPFLANSKIRKILERTLLISEFLSVSLTCFQNFSEMVQYLSFVLLFPSNFETRRSNIFL